MPPRITIDNRSIGADLAPYVVAEMSANHNGRFETAVRIIEEAKDAGADAVKLQTYTPDTITLDSHSDQFRISDGLWAGRTLHELYKVAHMPWEWHKPLFEHARRIGITIFSSPFDSTAVDLLEDLNAPAYKIASFEAIDLPLIRYAASTRKPIIISTGMASAEEIEEAVFAARESGCRELALLHCVSCYPAEPESYNLRTIADLGQRFDVVAGLSDHTIGNATAIASIPLGAAIIEKHFTLNRNGGGADDSFSAAPDDLRALCSDVRSAWGALGGIVYGCKPGEQRSIHFRRSLYFVKDLKQGDLITSEAVRSVRPGFGLAPKHLPEVIGRRVVRSIRKGSPVQPSDYR